MLLSKSNMKVIHWEYDTNLIGQEDSAAPVTRIGATIDSETGKTIGLYFVWKYLLQKGDQVCFNCVCQDSYIIKDMPGLNIIELKTLLYKSFGKFKGALLERLDVPISGYCISAPARMR